LARLEDRLVRLEARTNASRKNEEAALRQEVLRRMTDEELRTYEAALRRAVDAGGFTEEDQPILKRAAELYEEVCREFEAPA
jgi:hypothetical protein